MKSADAKLIAAIESGYLLRPRLFPVQLMSGKTVWMANTPIPSTFHRPSCRQSALHVRVGSGTHASRAIALRKSLLEALERRAFEECLANPQLRIIGGFDRLADTSGMAAGLSWWGCAARRRALEEAAERWTVESWWMGYQSARPLPRRILCMHECGLEILNPCGYRVAILWHDTGVGRVYGFAAGKTLRQSYESAHIEMTRNRLALQRFMAAPIENRGSPSRADRRLLYFASSAGVAAFDERVHHSTNQVYMSKSHARRAPALLIDRELQGPWSTFGRVWRCVMEGTSWLTADDDHHFAF